MSRSKRSLSNFLVEDSQIENRDSPYTADDYIPTPNNISADFLHSFDQN